MCKLGHCQRRQWCLFSRLDDHRAASRQRRGNFAGNHRIWKIPWGNCGGHADRLLDDDQALVIHVWWNDIAVNALTFLREPLNERSAVHDFPLGLGQRFALFGGENQCQIIGIQQHQIVPAA